MFVCVCVCVCTRAVICHMEGSGKWPHDRLAIRHIKAAFHIRLAELLRNTHKYPCNPTATHLDVWKVAYLVCVCVCLRERE